MGLDERQVQSVLLLLLLYTLHSIIRSVLFLFSFPVATRGRQHRRVSRVLTLCESVHLHLHIQTTE